MARDYLAHLARREPTDPAVLAAAAQAHATLALNDRLGGVIDRLAAPLRTVVGTQAEADDAAIDRVVAQGSVHADAVVRFVQEELAVRLSEHENVTLRRLVAAARADHPLQAADKAWYEAQKRNAMAAGDPQAIRAAADEHNRARTERQYDTSQYADALDPTERTWANAGEVAELARMEATIDPDVAATNAARRREERERAAMDRQVARGGGVFGQMAQREGEDG